MTPPTVARRRFLAGAAGLVAAAACSGGGSTRSGGTRQAGAGGGVLTGSFASGDLYVGPEQRVALGVLRDPGNHDLQLVQNEPVRIGFAPEGKRPTDLLPAEYHGAGIERGIYVVRTRFDRPGTWEATIEAGGRRGTTPVEVSAAPKYPAPGGAAVRAPSPTPAAPLGVNPICTRQPPCPFHTVSLDAALGTGRPIALMFATPARCQSRMCGPVLELLVKRAGDHPGTTFIHVEIYKDLQSNDAVPTFDAWHLETEPWLFAIDARGTIVDRLDGAFDDAEIQALLGRLDAR